MARSVSAPDFLPIRVQRAGEHLLLRLIDIAEFDWSAGFFRDGVPTNAQAHAMRGFPEWQAALGQRDLEYNDVTLIFHVARCGSTLLARNIEATGHALVLREPPFFSVLHGRDAPDATPSARMDIALAILEPWRRFAKRQGKPLVIKLSSRLNRFMPELVEAMPGARLIALHREPLAVLESLDRKRSDRPEVVAAAREAPLPEPLAGFQCDPYVLGSASIYLRTLDAMRDLPEHTLKLGYAELAAKFGEVLTHIGLEQATAPEWTSASNAKASGTMAAEPYVPVAPARLAEFAEANGLLIEQLEKHYTAFCETIRQTEPVL